ncbi:ATP-dependent 6-phosphofructokinase, partial [Dolichospermum sp. ST_sed1]|nr:ATP-dependent 6-phosphofructokinase [Dolichospermum sp. ST_sed1]
MRIGLCTGGGDCPGLNAAIRAVVKHAIGTYGFEVIGIRDGFNGLMAKPEVAKPLTIPDVTPLLHRGGTILGTFNRDNPFLDPKRKEKSIQATVDGYKKLGLDCLIVIGGDGTQGMAMELLPRGVNIIGIPKTIDNDLPETDRTIGFTTAVDLVSESVTRLQSTAESHDRLMILEVMGRDSGYIALHGGLAGGAHIILVPEIPFTYDAIIGKLDERKKLGRNYSVLVVAEGATEAGNAQTYQENAQKQKNLGGIGAVISHELAGRISMESRITVLGHL